MMIDAGACEPLLGDEFIFDVQTHHVNPEGGWRDNGGFEAALRSFVQSTCGELDFVDCFDADHYLRELFGPRELELMRELRDALDPKMKQMLEMQGN